MDDEYFMCHVEQLETVAFALRSISTGLSFKERSNFCMVAVNIKDRDVMRHLCILVEIYSKNLPITFSIELDTTSSKEYEEDLMVLETYNQILTVYVWLSRQLDTQRFTQIKEAEMIISNINSSISNFLFKEVKY
ncbi:hypothetical protein ZOSMA_187G00020 [Zostera marina]|uniref:ATP-dependent RNA helicase SUV3 C-terminal domain-containing protein n=1 Tax=Zostera marina TaxID=29655 RepID=A0A0K9PQ98_ZOSMR|nr:hypothetical protein ZOSMA_187G00020 [Zostera marina]